MRILVVLAHPLADSLNARLAGHVCERLRALGHSVALLDLYRSGFDPVLSPQERSGYYDSAFPDHDGLQTIDGLVLVFPTWWFGLPAILKGWIDRRFLPGVAYDHAPDLGALTPRLTALRHVCAVTTLGSPAIYDWLFARRPVYRALKWGVFKAVAPKARFRYHAFYRAEQASPERIARHEERLSRTLARQFGKATT